MSEDPKSARLKMTTHELLLSLHERLDHIDERLDDGAKEFRANAAQLKRDSEDIGLAMSAVQALCLVRGLDEHAAALGEALRQRFPKHASDWDDKTNPGGPRPSQLPDAE